MTTGELDPQGLGGEADTEPDQDNKYVKRTGSVKRSLQRVMPAIFQPTLPVTTRYNIVAPCAILAPCTTPLEACLACYPALACVALILFSKYAIASEVVHQPHACLRSTPDQYPFSIAAAVKPGKVHFFKLQQAHRFILNCFAMTTAGTSRVEKQARQVRNQPDAEGDGSRYVLCATC